MYYTSGRVRKREQGRQYGCLCVHHANIYISVCAFELVCILFMARNQLSLAHNGNVNSPERVSPTQGEDWLGAGYIFPNQNSERELARLKWCPLSSPSLEWSTALPIHYSNRSSKHVSLAVRNHNRTDMCTHVTHTGEHTYTHACRWKGDVAHVMTDIILYMNLSEQQPQNVMLNLT